MKTSGNGVPGLHAGVMVIEDALTERVIGCAFKVQNTLGCGFLEKIYENALLHECSKAGLEVRAQHPIRVLYDHIVVGNTSRVCLWRVVS